MKTAITILVGFAVGWYATGCWLESKEPEPARTMTVLEVEQEFNVELLVPTVRELQGLANRRGAEIKEDNIWGKQTAGALEGNQVQPRGKPNVQENAKRKKMIVSMKIQSGNWEEGILVLSGMPEDFVLSARTLIVMEEGEYVKLLRTRPKEQKNEQSD